MISSLLGTIIECLIGYLFIAYIPGWLKVRGIFATILRVIGVLIIFSALFSWVD